MKTLLAAAFISALMILPTQAKTVTADGGGYVIKYALEVNRLRRSGEPVRIAGPCYSACTLYLSLANICVTPRAKFGFHLPSGSTASGNRIARNYMMRAYPDWVKVWQARNGGLSSRVIVMSYSVAAQHIRKCV